MVARVPGGSPPPSPGAAPPHRRLWYRFCQLICQGVFLLYFRGRVFGTAHVPRTGAVILVCNHQSFLDPVLATLALPRECDYMARDTLFHHRVLRRLIESLNAYPVRRGQADVAAVRESLRRLHAGRVLTAFPEATRTFDGRIGPLHAGAALLARRSGAPLVPTLILGAFEAWPRQARWPRPAPVIVAYGPPLRANPHTSDEQLMEQVRQRLLELREHYARHPLLAQRREGCAPR